MSEPEKNTEYWLSITPFELSEPDMRSLLTKEDNDFPPHTWDDLKNAIANQDLGALTRYPTDMRRYLLWRRAMKTAYPDISQYIITHRLHWPPPTKGVFAVQDDIPFANKSDYRLLRNDWPYAVPADIAHVVVWLKTRIQTDEQGEPTEAMYKLVEEFVERVFRSRLNRENAREDAEVIWFKNPTRWQSVRTLEHVHVLLRGVDDTVVEELTGQKSNEIIARTWDGEEV